MKSKISPKSNDDDEWDDYCLDRLFDPEELYYVPMKELVKRYKKRSMIPGRVYNLAKKYGYVPDSRTRVIHAPQMRRANQRIFGDENFYEPPPKVFYCTAPKHPSDVSSLGNETSSSEVEEDEESAKSYQERMRSRRNLRQNLNKLDLDPQYLKRKKDLTEMEKRILNRLIYVEKEVQTDPIVEKIGKQSNTPPPKIEYPTPGAMERIEKFLSENRWRLVDLFKDLDKNKDWRVKRDDLKRERKKGRLDISDSMIEELVTALGNKTLKINYKSLAKGRTSHLSERRAQFRESRESIRSKDESESDNDDTSSRGSPYSPYFNSRPVDSKLTPKSDQKLQRLPQVELETRIVLDSISPVSARSSPVSSNHLQLPRLDLRPEKYNRPEIRFRDQMTNISRPLSKDSDKKTLPVAHQPAAKNSLDKFKENEEIKFKNCLEKTRMLFDSDLTLRRGFLNPVDLSKDEIIDDLKLKDSRRKKQSKKNRKNFLE